MLKFQHARTRAKLFMKTFLGTSKIEGKLGKLAYLKQLQYIENDFLAKMIFL